MKDNICVVEVGIHPPPYWTSIHVKGPVCTRHKEQFENRYIGPDEVEPNYDWKAYIPEEETKQPSDIQVQSEM